jgi:RNA polymerase sigma-70 factor (ECF subfamily)
MPDPSSHPDLWIRRLKSGDREALSDAFAYYRSRLKNMIRVRLDSRLTARVDPSDVLQEAFVDASRQVQGFVRQPRVMTYVWLRGLAWQRLLKIQRRHLGAQRRDAGRELSLPLESSVLLARHVLSSEPTPSQQMLHEELRDCVQRALAELDPVDREVILMRDFEDMSNVEVAQALSLKPAGATMRYGRALFRLKELLLAESSAAEAPP